MREKTKTQIKILGVNPRYARNRADYAEIEDEYGLYVRDFCVFEYVKDPDQDFGCEPQICKKSSRLCKD